MDKAGQKYWDKSWEGRAVPDAVDPSKRGRSNWINLQFHRYFSGLFKNDKTSSMTLLEIGCANSVWLPYFAKQFGFKITGLDYSPTGCELARKVLEKSGVTGEVVCTNFFTPPPQLIGTFDVVISFGVVEHFEDTMACLKALSAFLKPNGLLVTSIPNMVGSIGLIQKFMNRQVYDIHKPISPDMLRACYENLGLKVIECEYFIATNYGVNNLAGIDTNNFKGVIKKMFLAVLSRISHIIWKIEDSIGKLTPRKFASPYIICVGQKKP
jgi:2-polyprenyl-3-methyl-5-hydroxy-6-metoxy-1,4-benzoquinol methylase